MKILVDGDNCNVIDDIENIAKSFGVTCHIYVNYCRNIDSNYSIIHTVECTKDAADFALINNCTENDIVITNDSGLAAMVLSKKAFPINTHGLEYTKYNIMKFLNSRYMRASESRRSNRHQVKRLRDTRTSHKPFNVTLTNCIRRAI